jgi:S1-C subfamily serine protease
MSLLPSPLVDRLALGLASGLLVTGALVIGFWINPVVQKDAQTRLSGARVHTVDTPSGAPPYRGGSAARPTPESLPDSSEEIWGEAALTGVRSSRQHSEEDAALLTALERLDRQTAAGMLRARDSAVALEYTAGTGSPSARHIATGVVINSRGDVLSVRIDRPIAGSKPGVVSDYRAIVARDAAGHRHLAHWIASDPESGLTLLRIAGRSVRPIEIAPDAPALGSPVFVVGNPFGLGHTVSRGHIAGLDRALNLGTRQLGGLIQIQAPLYPGDSGAVVANVRGQLLGLIRSGLAIPAAAGDRTEHDNDFGFAIAARDVLWVADQLRARGHVDRAYLGVRLEATSESWSPDRAQASTPHDPLSPQFLEAPNKHAPSCEGALLQEVLTGTPAAKAGLQVGDTIIGANGDVVRSPADLTDRLDRLPAQAMIRLEVIRGLGTAQQHLTVTFQTAGRREFSLPAGLSPSGSKGELESRQLAQVTFPTVTVTSSAVLPKLGSSPMVHVGKTSLASPAGVVQKPRDRKIPSSSSPGQGTEASQADNRPKAEPQPPVLIPPPVRSPLRVPVPPPQAEELKLTLPRAVIDRLERLERRLELLERQNLAYPASRQSAPEPNR